MKMTENITEPIMINTPSESQADTRAEANVVITCPLGLHARPAAKLVKLAQDFPCTITLLTEHTTADAQSILDILTLSASCGSTVTVQCDGEKALLACERITQFLESEMGDLPNG